MIWMKAESLYDKQADFHRRGKEMILCGKAHGSLRSDKTKAAPVLMSFLLKTKHSQTSIGWVCVDTPPTNLEKKIAMQ